MVRPSYRANLAGDNGQPFFAFIFDPSQEGRADPDDLRGGARAPRRFVGWQTFFDFGDGQVKPNKRIDTKISTPLFHLPLGRDRQPRRARPRCRSATCCATSPGSCPPARASPARSASPRSPAPTCRSSRYLGVGFERSTPLWYYVLKEAEVVADGLQLGPGRRAHRRRGAHRPAADRPRLLPGDPTALAAHAAEPRAARSG